MSDWIRTSSAIISTLTGRRYGAHEQDRCERDNAQVKEAATLRAKAAGATREPTPAEIRNGTLGLPQAPVSVNRRIALEKAQKNPTGDNPFDAAIILAKSKQAVGSFTSEELAKEIETLEQDRHSFEARKVKLSALPKRPEPEPANVLAQAIETLRNSPCQPGEEKLREKMIQSLQSRIVKDTAADIVEQAEREKREDPALQRATFFQREQLLDLEKRPDVPQAWILEARERLRRLEAGEMSVLEFWNVEVETFEERKSVLKNQQLAANADERARLDAADKAIKNDQAPPAAPAPNLYDVTSPATPEA